MSLRLAMLVSIALALATFDPVIAAARYVATPLGSLGGDAGTSANGISGNAQVVGTSHITANVAYHAFRYTGGAMLDLGTLGGQLSWGYAINHSGQVTGEAYPSNGPGRAFLFTSGVVADLGTLGGPRSTGWGISRSGHVTGSAQLAGGAMASHAFLHAAGAMRDLGTLGGLQSEGRGINDFDEVTGWSDDPTGVRRAFLHSGGVMRDLNALMASGPSGWRLVVGRAINNRGQVAGDALTPGFDTRGFVYTSGKVVDIGTLGGTFSSAYAINMTGDAVGISATDTGDTRAFIYTDGALHDLNTLLVAGLGSRVLTIATGINDSGQIVANSCAGGDCLAFRLDPIADMATDIPLLSAGPLLALTLLVLAIGVRHHRAKNPHF